MRYKITVEYDGSSLHGWQRQEGRDTVQGLIEGAIQIISKQNVVVLGSGRTDAGVHAIGQVAHFDLDSTIPPWTIQSSLNYFLKPRIAITDISVVDTAFHARFSAKQRVYEYRILNRKAYSALLVKKAWHVPFVLNLPLMESEIKTLIGEYDFTSLRSNECEVSNPTKTVDDAFLSHGKDVVYVHIAAKSFLYNQIRIIVGTLVDIGRGHLNLGFSEILQARNRQSAGVTAPAYGLYFCEVKY